MSTDPSSQFAPAGLSRRIDARIPFIYQGSSAFAGFLVGPNDHDNLVSSLSSQPLWGEFSEKFYQLPRNIRSERNAVVILRICVTFFWFRKTKNAIAPVIDTTFPLWPKANAEACVANTVQLLVLAREKYLERYSQTSLVLQCSDTILMILVDRFISLRKEGVDPLDPYNTRLRQHEALSSLSRYRESWRTSVRSEVSILWDKNIKSLPSYWRSRPGTYVDAPLIGPQQVAGAQYRE